jgi:hypothetical protein
MSLVVLSAQERNLLVALGQQAARLATHRGETLSVRTWSNEDLAPIRERMGLDIDDQDVFLAVLTALDQGWTSHWSTDQAWYDRAMARVA